MVGGEYSVAYLQPSFFSDDIHEDENPFHEGNINVHTFNAYALFGISNKLNFLMRFPFIVWRQKAEHEDVHHRTETIKGFSDISLGAKWLIKNEALGPGHRLFVGIDFSLPTGKSYDLNPFSENTAAVSHSHFTLGDGHYTLSINLEWWYRSEFPFILGILSNYEHPLNTSKAGLKSGQKLFLNLQAIRQKPLFGRFFPYFKLNIRDELPDYWEGEKALNSAGIFVDGTVALDFEISESKSAILSFDFPIWQSLEGNQMVGYIISFSFRNILNF